MKRSRAARWSVFGLTCLGAAFAGAATQAVQGLCGPFTDVSPIFCPYVLEAYYTGITAGTSPTTFSPDVPITRGQAAVFVTKGLDQALARSSRRAAMGQWWTPQTEQSVGLTSIPATPFAVACDGADVWVANGSFVSRVRASDGRLLESWIGADIFGPLLIAMGKVFSVGATGGAVQLYAIDPSQPAGAAVAVATLSGNIIGDLAFDGSRIWVVGADSMLIVTLSSTPPWSVTTLTTGFANASSVLYDGVNVWVTCSPSRLLRLDANGAVIQTVSVGSNPRGGVFDGENLWIPDWVDQTLTVVRSSTGTVLATLTGNGLNPPISAAFDGQRVLVTSSGCMSVWKAADLTPVGCFASFLGNALGGVASDGINFWIGVQGTQNQLARF